MSPALTPGTIPAPPAEPVARAPKRSEWPLWEVFVRSKAGLDHKHCGSLHAADPQMAIQLARDVYTRRQEGTSIWVIRSDQITASDPGEGATSIDEDKIYRHPTFYERRSLDHERQDAKRSIVVRRILRAVPVASATLPDLAAAGREWCGHA
jgi:ring-1,2-phenylacetyl-CoA epoxidase subunit PaaB